MKGHYIVSSEFGATYPIEFEKLTLTEMKKYKGAWGIPLNKCKTWEDVFELLPHYIDKKIKRSLFDHKELSALLSKQSEKM